MRDPDSSVITGTPERGSYVSVYWVLDGYHDVWNRWALRQVKALHAAGRMFEERDHVHTLLYNFCWEQRRDQDGVPIELALDHPYRGFVPVFIDRSDSITNEELWEWLRNEHLPSLLPGTDADLVAAFTPIALEVDAPGDVPREAASDKRTLLLWFLNTPPEVAWEPTIAEHRRQLEASGKGNGGGGAAIHPDDSGYRHLHRSTLERLNGAGGSGGVDGDQFVRTCSRSCAPRPWANGGPQGTLA